MLAQVQVGQQFNTDGSQPAQRGSRDGSAVVTESHGRYTEASTRGNLFMAHATVTAPVIFSTAAATGGPLIWNGSSNKNVNILKVGFSSSVVTTVAGGLGFTGNTGQVSAPGSTTAIDGSRNLLLGGPASAATAYRVGTPTNAGNFFMPFAQFHTGALTVDTTGMNWLDTEGILTAPPGTWVSVAGSATLSTLQVVVAVVWEELPV